MSKTRKKYDQMSIFLVLSNQELRVSKQMKFYLKNEDPLFISTKNS